jgi:hypothetical protein
MEGGFASPHGPGQRVIVVEIGEDVFHAGGQHGGAAGAAHDGPYRQAPLDEDLDEHRAEVAGGAGDQEHPGMIARLASVP